MPGAEFLNAFSGNLGENILGPKYDYHTKIRSPKELGMSPEGSMRALAKDVEGIIAYVEILVEGGGKANRAGKALGDRFFLKTAAKCKDVNTKKEVDRYHYINNQIDGKISLPGFKVNTGLKGLIPGVISDITKINPAGLLAGFVEGSKPWCKKVKKKVIDNNSNESYQTHHIALSDLKAHELNANDRKKLRNFKKNMKSNDKQAQCKESFQNLINKDQVPNLYITSVSLLMIYLLYNLYHK